MGQRHLATGGADPFIGASMEKECTCTFAQRMVGDGCEVCNPAYALEMASESLNELRIEHDRLLADAKWLYSGWLAEHREHAEVMLLHEQFPPNVCPICQLFEAFREKWIDELDVAACNDCGSLAASEVVDGHCVHCGGLALEN